MKNNLDKGNHLSDVVIVARMPGTGISGGRYHALIMAEALAEQGVDVCLWVDCYPSFFAEFSDFPCHDEIVLHVDPMFTNPPDVNPNLVVVVPHMTRLDKMYFSAINFTQRKAAYLALLNFESPNWFNSLSPVPKKECLWNGWRLCARYADAIISSTKESEKWARRYYGRLAGNALFPYLYPPVNEYALQKSRTSDTSKVEIVCITRFNQESSHKGAKELAEAINERWRGRKLNIICGHPPEGVFWQQILAVSKKHGVEVQSHCRVSEVTKFELLRKASLLVFFTQFEGYGYPPVEAIWSRTPVICSDLPVLREVIKGVGHYVTMSRDLDLGDEIEKVLEQQGITLAEAQIVMQTTSIKAFGTKLGSVYDQLVKTGHPVVLNSNKTVTFKICHAASYLFQFCVMGCSCLRSLIKGTHDR